MAEPWVVANFSRIRSNPYRRYPWPILLSWALRCRCSSTPRCELLNGVHDIGRTQHKKKLQVECAGGGLRLNRNTDGLPQ
jgi:hypothetical protein